MSVDRVLTGLAAFAGGVVAGILLAPQSGAETREQISGEAKASLRRLEGQIQGLEKRLADLGEQLKEGGQELGDKVKKSTIDQVLPEVPGDPAAFDLAGDDVSRDLRHMPRK